MKNTKHTQGPWTLKEYEHDTFRIRSDLSHRKHTSTEESVAIITGSKANAHLIAAAPEMLRILELASHDLKALKNSCTENETDFASELEEYTIGYLEPMLNEAIKKARGES